MRLRPTVLSPCVSLLTSGVTRTTSSSPHLKDRRQLAHLGEARRGVERCQQARLRGQVPATPSAVQSSWRMADTRSCRSPRSLPQSGTIGVVSVKKEKQLLRRRFLPREATARAACPECQAEPEQPCIGRSGPRVSHHQARQDQARALLEARVRDERAARTRRRPPSATPATTPCDHRAGHLVTPDGMLCTGCRELMS